MDPNQQEHYMMPCTSGSVSQLHSMPQKQGHECLEAPKLPIGDTEQTYNLVAEYFSILATAIYNPIIIKMQSMHAHYLGPEGNL